MLEAADPQRDAIRIAIGKPDRMGMLAVRIGAYIVDLLIFVLPLNFLHKAYSIPASADAAIGLMALSFLLVLGVLEGVLGGSPGKLLLRIRIVDGLGRPPGILRAVARRCLLVVDLFFGGLVGLVTILRSKHAQRVGDVLTDTYVVDAAQLARVREVLRQADASGRA